MANQRAWLINRRVATLRDTQPRDSSPELTPDSHVRVVVRRRQQQVVVRAGSASSEPGERVSCWTRSSTPTLIGLDVRERQDTLPEQEVPQADLSVRPESCPGSKQRPVVLREGIDDALAEYYRQEAQRILDSGVFGMPIASP